MLAFAGGALGAVLAFLGTGALASLAPDGIPAPNPLMWT